MDLHLFEYFTNKYDYYLQIIDRLANLKANETDSLVSFLIEKITINKVYPEVIYQILSDSCELNIKYIREYWDIYDKIYQYCKIKPKIYNSSSIIYVLFAKKYNIKVQWELEYKSCKDKSFDEVLNYFESNTTMRCIIHDDIKGLKEIINIESEFNFNKEIFGKLLIDNCCFCGSVECFKFLRSNGVEITKKSLNYSIDGRNKFIINECLQNIVPDEDTMIEIIKIHDFEMAVSFSNLYDIEIPNDFVADLLDLRLFLYLISNSTKFDIFFHYSPLFRIDSLIDDIYNLRGNIKGIDENGQTPLFRAVSRNYIEGISKLVELGADVDAKDETGMTPLFEAAFYDNVESIVKLVEFGADVNATNDDLQTPLFYAASYNCVASITKLVELGAKINATDNHKMTPLFSAVFFNSVDAIEKLINLGANIEAKDCHGETALFKAAYSNENIDAVIKLVELGANIEARNENNETPLFKSVCIQNNNATISKLIELGACIEARDDKNRTPLILASIKNNTQAIRKLIELGADTTVKDIDGNTPNITAI